MLREALRQIPVRSVAVAALFLGGVGCLAMALWWVMPALGLGFVGVASVALSFALAKNG